VDGQRRVFIGGDFYLNEAVLKKGVLDFLIGLSSANTEVVYLGSEYVDSATEISSRVNFYRERGFLEAAEHLRSRMFPDIKADSFPKSYYDKLPAWDQADAAIKNSYVAAAKRDVTVARKRYESSMARTAISNYRSDLIANNLINATKPERSILPSTLAYPDAWQAYVDFKTKSPQAPPDWFITEFLQPLGFDKRIANVE
jgi:hypothetical protein